MGTPHTTTLALLCVGCSGASDGDSAAQQARIDTWQVLTDEAAEACPGLDPVLHGGWFEAYTSQGAHAVGTFEGARPGWLRDDFDGLLLEIDAVFSLDSERQPLALSLGLADGELPDGVLSGSLPGQVEGVSPVAFEAEVTGQVEGTAVCLFGEAAVEYPLFAPGETIHLRLIARAP